MPENRFQALAELGFTELEVEVYVALLRRAPVTGYRIAQDIARPVANTYKAIESLQLRGAVLVDEGANRLCRAVGPEELLAQLERSFQDRRRQAAAALATVHAAPEDDRVYQLHSVDQVFERCRQMLSRCEQTAILDLFPKPLDDLRDSLEHAARRGVRVLVKAYDSAAVSGVDVLVHPQGHATLQRWPGQWLNAVTDGREHLIAFLTADLRGIHQAIWSGSAYLSWIYHSAVGAETILAAILRGLTDGATSAELRQTVADYQHVFNASIPGAHALLQRFGPQGPARRTPEDT
jgi:sugar-specific transcriptional regulator TrmB